MKYYIGRVVINDYESRREYSADACFAAKSYEAAWELLKNRARDWDSDAEEEQSSGGYRFAVADAPYSVVPYSLQDITPATFAEMSHLLPTFAKDSTGDLAKEEPDERAKTLARRIGAQLTKLDAKVAHSKLLHAVAASIGETDWQVLVHQKAPAAGSAPEQSTPTQSEIPGTGFLYRVPVSVDTSMTAIVLARGDTPEDAIEAARQFAAEGKANFEVDDGNYRGLADHYCSDSSENGVYRVDEPLSDELRLDPEEGSAGYGPYVVEVTSLGGSDDELLWADLRVFTANREEADSESCLSSCPVTASPDFRAEYCGQVASLLYRCAPDPSKVEGAALRNLFVRAVQGGEFAQLERIVLPPR